MLNRTAGLGRQVSLDTRIPCHLNGGRSILRRGSDTGGKLPHNPYSDGAAIIRSLRMEEDPKHVLCLLEQKFTGPLKAGYCRPQSYDTSCHPNET